MSFPKIESKLPTSKVKPTIKRPTPPKDKCSRCGDTRIRQLSARREASECLEPSHRKVVGVKIISEIRECTACGKRWKA